jgi:hypothetical protein
MRIASFVALTMLAAAAGGCASKAPATKSKHDAGRDDSFMPPEDDDSNDDDVTWPSHSNPRDARSAKPVADAGAANDAGGLDDDAALPGRAGSVTIVYAAPMPIGLDHRVGAIPTLGVQGELLSYFYDQDEAPMLGTLHARDVADVSASESSRLVIGRWSGGAAAGTFFGQGIRLEREQSFHYIVGAAAPWLPDSGEARYADNGGAKTTPSTDDGTLASSFGGVSAKAAFGTPTKIALTLTMPTSAGGTATIATTGGLDGPQSSELVTFASANEAHVFGGRVAAAGCGAGCTALVRGFFAGPHADRLALAIVLRGAGAPVTGSLVLAR